MKILFFLSWVKQHLRGTTVKDEDLTNHGNENREIGSCLPDGLQWSYLTLDSPHREDAVDRWSWKTVSTGPNCPKHKFQRFGSLWDVFCRNCVLWPSVIYITFCTWMILYIQNVDILTYMAEIDMQHIHLWIYLHIPNAFYTTNTAYTYTYLLILFLFEGSDLGSYTIKTGTKNQHRNAQVATSSNYILIQSPGLFQWHPTLLMQSWLTMLTFP